MPSNRFENHYKIWNHDILTPCAPDSERRVSYIVGATPFPARNPYTHVNRENSFHDGSTLLYRDVIECRYIVTEFFFSIQLPGIEKIVFTEKPAHVSTLRQNHTVNTAFTNHLEHQF